jgi:hypothetical protein
MALEFAPTLSDALLDAIETHIGTAPLLKVFTGTPPATLATADSGTLLANMTLPSDWMLASSSGSKAKSGTWNDTSADAAGTPGHFRVYTSAAVAKIQGTAAVGSGDLNFDATISLGGTVTVSTFTLTGGNLDA